MPSSGMLCHVALVRTDVLKERITTIIRVTRISELGTTLAATSNRRMLQRNTIRQMFKYMKFTLGFVKAYFNQHKQVHVYSRLYENIVQYFPPNRIIDYHEVYE
jgi:hypothetical protein